MTDRDKIALAAQADLVLLAVDMLRAPIELNGHRSKRPSWCELQSDELDGLLRAARLSAGSNLSEALYEVFTCVGKLDVGQWSDEYWRLFDGSTACPINEAAYIRRDKGTILGDACGFYRAFGWQHAVERSERPDHLLCELEFVAVLLAMASQANVEQQREVTTSALTQFARIHLHDWLPSVSYMLCEVTELAYFGAVANWLLLLWESLSEYHAWPIDASPGEPLLPASEPENPYECGAPDLVQLSSRKE